jgi:hypothetical protein
VDGYSELEEMWREVVVDFRHQFRPLLGGTMKTKKKKDWGTLVPGLTLNNVKY